jgi:trk system potassium uptake protein TrkH
MSPRCSACCRFPLTSSDAVEGGIQRLPLFLVLAGCSGLAMAVPAVHGFALGDYAVARSFFYHGLMVLFFCALVAIATAGRQRRTSARRHLAALVAALVLLPVIVALPMADLLPGAPFLDVYFDMVGALTTTGASAFKGALPLDPTLHLWIGFVAWLGGFLFWLTAAAVLAPMGLGGFEVLGSRAANVVAGAAELRLIEAPERMMRTAAQLFPIYLGLTALLWFALYVSGDTAFVAFCHAMATIATSGLSPVGGPAASGAGLAGELFVFLFLFTAISRRLYLDALIWRSPNRLLSDREVQLALICLGVVPLALFLRHWFSAPADEAVGLAAALSGLWGALFTTMSFLTTHGVQSADWTAARNWSGLGDPGLILMGLALMGGGVGTTAGGIKLLRVHALYKHGVREMDRLVHPSSIGGAGARARALRREGAPLAWVFFMLFLVSVAVAMIALSLAGLDFDAALAFAIAALSTTGPVVAIAADEPLSYAALAPAAKAVLCVAMIVGRLETLALIALLNPAYWRG